jgi:hypothetical protein
MPENSSRVQLVLCKDFFLSPWDCVGLEVGGEENEKGKMRGEPFEAKREGGWKIRRRFCGAAGISAVYGSEVLLCFSLARTEFYVLFVTDLVFFFFPFVWGVCAMFVPFRH